MGDRLTAGMRLNRMVCEQVMRWKEIPPNENDWPACTQWYQPERDGRRAEYIAQTPPFSTTLATAWQVVQRMRELGWSFQLDDYAGASFPDDAWRAEFCQRTAFKSERQTTPALAICLAALLAVARADAPASLPPETR